MVALVVIDHLHRPRGHLVERAAGELRALAEQPRAAALGEADGRAFDGGTRLDIGPAQIAELLFLGELSRVVRRDRPADQMLEHVGEQRIVVELVRQLGEAEMELAPRDGLVDLGKALDQQGELAMQPVEIAVDRVELLPELGPEIEDVIVLAGRRVETPRDLALGLPVGPGGGEQGVLGCRHVFLRNSAAMIAAAAPAANVAGLPAL